ncbi:glycine cleavage system protein H, partial [Candidatus Bathyarchaeota archaeon]|nr:glycine cleavage system protein H [Candidatus Bathyarchaeota archaeon]
TGTIAEINPGLAGKPNLINDAPYGEGWVAVIEPEALDAELKELIKGSDKAALEAWLKEEIAKAGV